MPVPQLGKVMSTVKDPMVSDHFTMEIPLIPTGTGDAEPLMIHCQNATKPGLTLDEVLVALFGHTFVNAGRKVFNHDLNVTFVENSRGTIMRTLEKWAELCRGSETQHGRFKRGKGGGATDSDGYAANGKLSIFDNVGELALEYTLYNLWPANVPEVQYDGTGSNLITHSVGFKIDLYECTGGYSK